METTVLAPDSMESIKNCQQKKFKKVLRKK